jgi:hypothetical protein
MVSDQAGHALLAPSKTTANPHLRSMDHSSIIFVGQRQTRSSYLFRGSSLIFDGLVSWLPEPERREQIIGLGSYWRNHG